MANFETIPVDLTEEELDRIVRAWVIGNLSEPSVETFLDEHITNKRPRADALERAIINEFILNVVMEDLEEVAEYD